MRDAPRAVSMRHVRGELALDRVSFSYDGSSCALEEIELTIAPGETVALVGPSGAGKSTLVSLVQRFDDPSSGAIRLDGRDLRTIRLASLRAHIGAVLQDCAIFNETVFDNIACANPSASVDQVVAAARAAAAHEFIEALPDGYRTIAGERGVRFSAGQRQRIAIARAVLKDPRVLILDEATSAFDTDSEFLVRDALFRLARGRTMLIVAHPLATVVAADRIAVLRSGRIVETGSHDALLSPAATTPRWSRSRSAAFSRVRRSSARMRTAASCRRGAR